MIGTSLLHYHIVAKLGQGGMGTVYRATDTRLGRTVAIKVLTPEFAADPERRRRFAQEARAASALNHPNIITIYDITHVDGADCIVMEFVTGRTLEELVAGKGLELSRALDYGMQIAAALAGAHAAGIIHRDLKPANVVLTEGGIVKVLDFGLAKLSPGTGSSPPPVSHRPADPNVDPHSRLPDHPTPPSALHHASTIPGAILGTAFYMSPEQAEGKPVDARSDIFSFGALLYEMLTGHRAFRGDSLVAILSAVTRDEPTPARDLLPGLPIELERIVNRCLRKERADRYPAMTEVLEALRGIPRQTAKPSKPSIAVLPFANMSPDRENEYLSDGISEDLIMALSHLPGLRVPARTSSFAFKGKHEDIRKIAAMLDVETVLEGSVRKSGTRLRITAQLVKAADGFHLWSERYDREMKDVFEIQDEITRAIVDALKLQLAGEPEQALVKPSTQSTAAYELYLKGRACFYQRGIGLLRAQHYFELARLEDPNYALAWSGVADAHLMQAFYGFASIAQSCSQAELAATRAFELDPSLAEVQVSMATLQVYSKWQFDVAGPIYRHAISLHPNYPLGRAWYGVSLNALGKYTESVSQLEQALELDPLSAYLNTILAWMLVWSGRIQESLTPLRRALELQPGYPLARWVLGIGYLAENRLADAVAELEAASASVNRAGWILAYLGHAYGADHQDARAREILIELSDPKRQPYVAAFWIAVVQAGLGDLEATLDCLETAYQERSVRLLWIRSEPVFRKLHNHPRFQNLVHKIGLDR